MNKSKIFMIVSIGVLCITVIGSTIAYYRETLFNDLSVDTITHGLDYYINYAKGTDISTATLETSPSYTGGTNATVEFWKKDDTYDIYGHIYLDINEIGPYSANSPGLKYALVSGNKGVATGTLEGTSSGNSILIKGNIPLKTSEQLYTLYIWLDENEELDINMENENLSLTIRCEATMKPITNEVNGATLITNLYSGFTKTTVTNNNINYHYSKLVDLMADRLGGTTDDLDAGNIRFYGENPNNYIYFNCSNYNNQNDTNCEKWRIIGVFDEKIKMVKESSIGSYNWYSDTTDSGSGIPEYGYQWTDSNLNVRLNNSYYSSLNVTTQNFITEVTWNLGRCDSADVYPNEAYNCEINGTVEGLTGEVATTWSGEIALMYPSDYGYALNFSNCSSTLSNYGTIDGCEGLYNWLKLGSSEWLLTTDSGTGFTNAWSIGSSGNANITSIGTQTSDDELIYYEFMATRPTLYLKSDTPFNGIGDGTSDNPYQLQVS